MRNHRKLKAFRLADQLVRDLYEQVRKLPDETRTDELFQQIKRSGLECVSAIIKGCAMPGRRGYVEYLCQAYGLLAELGYLVDLAAGMDLLPARAHPALQAKHESAQQVLAALLDAIGTSHAMFAEDLDFDDDDDWDPDVDWEDEM
jgi:four helix bundle protein